MSMLAEAKNDVKILMEDNRYSNFIKGNKYRYLIKGDSYYLVDEDKMGFKCNKEVFKDNFIEE